MNALSARRAVVLFWYELPRSVAAGLLVLATAVPLVVAVVGAAPGSICALATLPPAVAVTGLARFAAATARGDGPRLAMLRQVDLTLGLLLAVGVSLPGVLRAVAGAALLLVLPYALAYGALRNTGGLRALRGGAILVAYRPSWALTLAALAVLGGFAAVASAGVLAPVVLPLLLTLAATQTGALLDEIDTAQGRAVGTAQGRSVGTAQGRTRVRA